jgi:tRNA pseudouridine55 synthase
VRSISSAYPRCASSLNRIGEERILEPFGFLVVDKPQGMTSHDVVVKVRRGTGIKRIGHAGTLDPMATGVLVLCIGAATRLSEYVMDSTKVYEARVRLGVETDTYDAEGTVISTADTSHITRADVESALGQFQGEVQQMPPMYSAIKQGGKKLYELARQGKEVDRETRTVWLQTELLDLALPDLTLRVTCSAGTYIRSVAHDLGAILGAGAHLTALRRVKSGSLDEPVPWQELIAAMQDGTWQHYLISERDAIPTMPRIELDERQTDDILHGRAIPRSDHAPGGVSFAYSPQRCFVAVVEGRDGVYSPIKVFHRQG